MDDCRMRIDLDDNICTRTVPYINDPMYLICCFTAKFTTCSTLFQRIQRTLIQVLGQELHHESMKQIQLLLPDIELDFNEIRLWFPTIDSLEKNQQNYIRLATMKIHSLLLEAGINFKVYHLHFRFNDKTTCAMSTCNHPCHYSGPLQHQIQSSLNYLIDVVMVNRSFVCIDKDLQHILIDWFCNDHDVFPSQATLDLLERLRIQKCIGHNCPCLKVCSTFKNCCPKEKHVWLSKDKDDDEVNSFDSTADRCSMMESFCMLLNAKLKPSFL